MSEDVAAAGDRDACICDGGPRATRGGRCIDCGEPAGPPAGDLGRCSACHKPILWVVSEHGKPMPLDLDPSPEGNVDVFKLSFQPNATGRVLAGEPLEQARAGGTALRTAHFVTCPSGEKFRRKRGQRRRSSA